MLGTATGGGRTGTCESTATSSGRLDGHSSSLAAASNSQAAASGSGRSIGRVRARERAGVRVGAREVRRWGGGQIRDPGPRPACRSDRRRSRPHRSRPPHTGRGPLFRTPVLFGEGRRSGLVDGPYQSWVRGGWCLDCRVRVRLCWGEEEVIAGGGPERAFPEEVLRGLDPAAGTTPSQLVGVGVGRTGARLYVEEGPQGHRAGAAEAFGERGGGVGWGERVWWVEVCPKYPRSWGFQQV